MSPKDLITEQEIEESKFRLGEAERKEIYGE